MHCPNCQHIMLSIKRETYNKFKVRLRECSNNKCKTTAKTIEVVEPCKVCGSQMEIEKSELYTTQKLRTMKCMNKLCGEKVKTVESFIKSTISNPLPEEFWNKEVIQIQQLEFNIP